ncbi:MAG: glycoside hydrolase family 2 protein, partial [Deltaproteobacteria bacterium]
TAEAWIYDIEGRPRWHRQASLSVPPASAQQCFPLTLPADLTPVYFVKLVLRRGPELISDNFYWAPLQNHDCTALEHLPRVALDVSAHVSSSHIATTVSNPTSAIALAVRLKAVDAATGNRILPAMAQDNYFSLLPGETRAITISFPQQSLASTSVHLDVEGWNVEPRTILI